MKKLHRRFSSSAILLCLSLSLNSGTSDVHAEPNHKLTAAEKSALTQAAEHPVTKPADLPLPVREILGLVKNPAAIAAPGERWEPGCTGGIDVPHERLILASASPNACIIHCEQGGYARFFTLRFYQIEGGRAKLIVDKNGQKEYKTMNEIVEALEK